MCYFHDWDVPLTATLSVPSGVPHLQPRVFTCVINSKPQRFFSVTVRDIATAGKRKKGTKGDAHTRSIATSNPAVAHM